MTWLDPEAITTAGIQPWEELPIWIPPGHEFSGLHDANADRAHSAGLTCRPVQATVLDTWRWLSGLDEGVALRADLRSAGLDADRERAALNAWHERSR